MNPKYTHDFSSASIKHLIEAEFYQKAGACLYDLSSSTIVTGPDYQRHIDNYNKHFKNPKLRICEIDLDIFIDIYKGCRSNKNITVVNKSIEYYGSQFIDCDLTCVSNLEVVKKTLLKQIDVLSSSANFKKAFIFSFGLRTGKPSSTESYLKPILGLLGAEIKHLVMYKPKIYPVSGTNRWVNQYTIAGRKGRIEDYICYEYNAGGGPMLTCLIIYK